MGQGITPPWMIISGSSLIIRYFDSNQVSLLSLTGIGSDGENARSHTFPFFCRAMPTPIPNNPFYVQACSLCNQRGLQFFHPGSGPFILCGQYSELPAQGRIYACGSFQTPRSKRRHAPVNFFFSGTDLGAYKEISIVLYYVCRALISWNTFTQLCFFTS